MGTPTPAADPVGPARSALLLTAPGTFAFGDVAEPALEGDTRLVDILYTGLCGTDLHIVAGEHPRATFPLAIGHELVGRVVDGPTAGTMVVVDPLLACGSCVACRLGRAHVCMHLRLIGIDTPGGLAGRVAVAPDRLHAVPAAMAPTTAALAEPLAVAVHAVRRSSLGPGATAVVLGAGPIGLLLALVARDRGAARIFVAERSAARRATAGALGFELLDADDPVSDLKRRTDDALADVAFDAAAVPAIAAILPRVVHPGGTIALVGVYGAAVPIDLQAVVFGELTLIGDRVYTPEDIDDALTLLAAGAIDSATLISDVVPVDATPEILQRLRAGDGIKYLVEIGRRR